MRVRGTYGLSVTGRVMTFLIVNFVTELLFYNVFFGHLSGAKLVNPQFYILLLSQRKVVAFLFCVTNTEITLNTNSVAARSQQMP